MLYTIRVRCVTSGSCETITRKREDCAYDQLYRAMYRSAQSQALLDTAQAWAAVRRVNAWTKRHPMEPIRLGSDVITIDAEK